MAPEAYAGIDVAFAKRKRLPVVVSVLRGNVLEPLPLRRATAKPSRGMGNARALDDNAVARFAEETAVYLRDVEREFDVKLCRVALDAPSDAKSDGVVRRQCELGLDRKRISCIPTPSHQQFMSIRARVRAHLESGGAESRLPAANQLWMIVGFSLFKRLRREWECLEVFPQAIAVTLRASKIPKRRAEGVAAQLDAARRHTGWPAIPNAIALREIGYGSSHDLLDAYLASWIASLSESRREAIGSPPNDVIWIPSLRDS